MGFEYRLRFSPPDDDAIATARGQVPGLERLGTSSAFEFRALGRGGPMPDAGVRAEPFGAYYCWYANPGRDLPGRLIAHLVRVEGKNDSGPAKRGGIVHSFLRLKAVSARFPSRMGSDACFRVVTVACLRKITGSGVNVALHLPNECPNCGLLLLAGAISDAVAKADEYGPILGLGRAALPEEAKAGYVGLGSLWLGDDPAARYLYACPRCGTDPLSDTPE